MISKTFSGPQNVKIDLKFDTIAGHDNPAGTIRYALNLNEEMVIFDFDEQTHFSQL